MYTVLWREDDNDRWDRLETKEEVKTLLDALAKNPDVCEGDIWIFTPEADEYARDFYNFSDDIMGSIMYTILWQVDDNDRWDRLETKEEVKILLDALEENPDVCEGDIWIFTPEADEYATDFYSF